MRLVRRAQIFHDRYPFLGPLLWLLTVQYFISQPLVASRWTVPFSLRHNTISDLANTACGIYSGRYVCSPWHALMNASFIMLGTTMFLGAALIYHEFRRSIWSCIGFIGMGLAGFGTLLVGVFPENTDLRLHIFGALLPFLVGNISIGILGIVLRLPKWLSTYSILTSLLTLTALLLLVTRHYGGLGIGGVERLTSYPQTVWLIVFGIFISHDRYAHPERYQPRRNRKNIPKVS